LVKPVKLANLVKAVGEMFGAIRVQTQHDETASGKRLSGRVLVVEDHPTNQKVIVLRLQKLGCTIDVAHNGLEAVEATENISFDAILMDCQMPVMDGFQATAKIRARGGQRVPIIALTANAMDGERERCLEADMDDYLSKPVRIEELFNKLQFWIGITGNAGDNPSGTVITSSADVRQALDHFAASMMEEGIDRSDVDDIFRSFLETSSTLIEELQEAFRRQDSTRLASVAHSLKGSFANFGLVSLVDFISDLERAGKNPHLNGVKEILDRGLSMYWNVRELVGRAICVPAN